MKRRNLLFVGLLFTLISCNQEVKTPESSSTPTSTSELRKELDISTTKSTFYQYDVISYKDFVVKDKTSQNQISDFEIYLNGKKLINNESRIFSFGKVSLVFIYDGYQQVEFEINVKRSTSFNEGIYIKTLPNKQKYKVGDSFSNEGLEVIYYLSYTRINNEKVNIETPCSDYQIKIDGINASEFEFNSTNYERKYALIKFNGEQGTPLYASFPITIEGKSKSNKIIDEEEKYNWTASNKKMKVSFKNEKKSLEKPYYSPTEVNMDFNANSFMDREATNYRQTPSIGNVPLLVVPVVLNGFEEEATEERHQLIEKAFFGKSSEESDIPFSSLSSYYYYSSFKQLKLSGLVTPYFNPTKEGFLGYSNPYSFSMETPSSLANDALSWAKEKLNINLDDFDIDNDGYVDGVWLIYMENINTPLTLAANVFWPFTGSTSFAPGPKESPTLNMYSWAGCTHLFGNQADPNNLELYGIDNHVLLHETGHLLGLNDYYSYKSSASNENNYAPLGKLDMMDANFGDHNPYSKMLLGWIKPYVVLDDCEIEIPSNQIENSVFLLPYDSKTYKTDSYGRIIVNPYDEYLLLDYFTYENLAKDKYSRNMSTFQYPNAEGGRLYHVDARALIYSNGKFSLPSNPDEIIDSSDLLYRGISNSQAGERAESNYCSQIKDYFDEIRWISKDKKLIDGGVNAPTENIFFKQGGKFSLNEYGAQFYYDGKFDNEEEFSTTFEITSLS